MHQRREIDGLRAVAVVPVILFHAGTRLFSGGFVGVDVFFVISGYLITSLIIHGKQSDTFTFLNFYERRLRRIFPALFLVMLFSLAFAWLLLPEGRKVFSESVGATTIFASNIFFWRASGYFEPAAELQPLMHTWSLAVEEQYYLLFPLFLVAVWRIKQRWIVAILVLLTLASYSAALVESRTHPALAFFLLPTRAWEILVGAIVAFVLEGYGENIRAKRIGELPSLIGLAAIICAAVLLDEYVVYPSQYTLIPVSGAALVVVFATSDTIVGRLLGSRIIVGIGLISYSAYLWHQPLFAFARNYCIDKPSNDLMMVLAIASFILAYFSWRFVETPFRTRGDQGFTCNQMFAFGICCGVFGIGVAISGAATNGFETNSERAFASYEKYNHQEFDRDGVCLLRADQTYKAFSGKCAPVDSVGGVVIWGDSYAGALSFGLRQFIPKLIQYTASGCPPIEDMEIQDLPNCKAINDYVLQQILRMTPRTVYLHANWMLYDIRGATEHLHETIDFIRRGSPGTKIIVIGSVPQWRPSLPAVLIRQRANLIAGLYVKNLSVPDLYARDSVLKAVANSNKCAFFSPLEVLCKNAECQATTVLNGNITLTAWDFGHLTAGGAVLLATRLIDEQLAD